MFRLNYTENAGIVTLSLTTPEMKLSINSFELLATSKDIHTCRFKASQPLSSMHGYYYFVMKKGSWFTKTIGRG
jgi:hypothetical protein